MYDYFKGIITKQFANYIVCECNNGIGYKIYTPNPYSFKLNEVETVYVYTHVREDEDTLYGFNSEEERNFFLKLINVKGLGPKMGLTMLATRSIAGIVDAIDRENILYLKKIPKIGEKLARQLVLDLKGKLIMDEVNIKADDELNLALESLGYKANDIKSVASKIDRTQSIELQIKDALKLLLK